jgi:hypothetical protein
MSKLARVGMLWVATLIATTSAALLAAAPANAGGTVTLCHDDREAGFGTNFADAIFRGGSVTFQCPSGTVIRLSQTYWLPASVTIDGGNEITLDAAGNVMFIGVHEGVHVTLTGLVLKNAQYTGPLPPDFAYFGSVVSGPITVDMNNVTVRDSKHPIDVDTFRVIKSSFIGNYDTVVRVQTFESQDTNFTCSVPSFPFGFRGTSSIMLDNVTITGCGRIWSVGTTTIKRSHFVGNQVEPNHGPGAALFLEAGTASVAKSEFVNNTADAGGAIYVSGGALKLRRVAFLSNAARGPRGGGAILAELDPTAVRSAMLEMQYVRFLGNSASIGGAVALTSASKSQQLTLWGDAMMFQTNFAGVTGGGLSLNDAFASLSRAVFVDNVAQQGGAIAGVGHASIRLANSLLVRNHGEGAAFTGPGLRLMNSTVAANQGPALVWQNPIGPIDAALTNSIVADNDGANCKVSSDGVGITDGGNNLQTQDESCGSTIPIADPQLDAQFYVPQPLSPARRAGNNCCLPGAAGIGPGRLWRAATAG